jgi:hypothetical protein
MVVVSSVVTVCVMVMIVQGEIESRVAEPIGVSSVAVAMVWFLALVKFHSSVGIRLTPGVGATTVVVVAWLLVSVKRHPVVASGLRVDIGTGEDDG